MYSALVFAHVLSGVVAVGANLTYAVWMVRGATSREHLGFALRGVKFIDDRVANPAYVLLFLTGGALVHFSGRSFAQPWIVAALVLYVLLAGIGLGLYAPALAKQIRLLDRNGPGDPVYAAAATRSTALGAATTVLALAVLGLMVFKPGGA